MRTIFILITLFPFCGFSQSPVEGYIQEALMQNVWLKQKNIDIEQAELALENARRLYFPSVAFQGNYSSGKGGRSIEIPVGDLMNPVYSTLNTLTGTSNFPQIENVSENFFPYNFYDAKIRTTMPIFQTGIQRQQEIVQDQLLLNQKNRDAYARWLVKEIKWVYYGYLQNDQLLKIHNNALERIEKERILEEKKWENGVSIVAQLARIEAEKVKIEAEIFSVQTQKDQIKRYFNFLLQCEANREIDIVQPQTIETPSILSVQRREELDQLAISQHMNETALKNAKQYFLPKVSGFLDVGSQASDWQVNNDSWYHLFGFQVDIPLFNANIQRNKIEIAKNEVEKIQLKKMEVDRQLTIASDNAFGNWQNSYRSFQYAEKQLQAALKYYQTIESAYKEGVATYLEWVDARTQLLAAEIFKTTTQYQVYQAYAVYEYENALYPITTQISE